MFSTRHAFLVGQHRLQCNYTARQQLGVKQTSSQALDSSLLLEETQGDPVSGELDSRFTEGRLVEQISFYLSA